MKNVLKGEEILITNVHSIMVKLSGLILGAKLAKSIKLKPKMRNITRWTPAFDMLNRYVEIRKFLPRLRSDVIHFLLLSSSENRHIDSIISNLVSLESVAKQFQSDSITVSDCRTLFDSVIENFPDTTNRLTSTADIVERPSFESGIVKLQRNSIPFLSRQGVPKK